MASDDESEPQQQEEQEQEQQQEQVPTRSGGPVRGGRRKKAKVNHEFKPYISKILKKAQDEKKKNEIRSDPETASLSKKEVDERVVSHWKENTRISLNTDTISMVNDIISYLIHDLSKNGGLACSYAKSSTMTTSSLKGGLAVMLGRGALFESVVKDADLALQRALPAPSVA